MTFVILFVLAVAWTAYGVMVWRSRAERRNVNSISSFSKHLNVLERTSPTHSGFDTVPVRVAGPTPSEQQYIVPAAPGGPGSAPLTLAQAQRRRRDLLVGLGGFSLLNVLLGGLVGGLFVVTGVLTVVAFAGYVLLLARSQQLANETAATVRYLPSSVHDDEYFEAEPAYLRSAN